jgi:hypothetical protein
MINVPCETELLEEVHQWVSSHCQGLRFYGDRPEQAGTTTSPELELVVESDSQLPAASPVSQRDVEESPETLGSWLNKVRDRIRVEASLCREFSARRLSENAKRIYAARAAALEFAFTLLTETSNPMGYVDTPVPDHHVHPPERGIRSRRSETQHFTEVFKETPVCPGE